MNDIVESARSARQKLAAALALLQTPEAGDVLDTVAEPVARAMGALHGIETSNGQSLAAGGPGALDAVRQALAALQAVPENPTLDRASAEVAGSLGLVHVLAQRAAAAHAQPAQPSRPPVPRPNSSRPPAGFSSSPAPSIPAAPAAPNFAKTTPSVAPPPEPLFAKTAPSVTPSKGQKPVSSVPPAPPGAGAFDKTAIASRSPVAHLDHTQPARPVTDAPAPAPVIHTPAADRWATSRSMDSKHAPAPSVGPDQGALIVEANLGAHSPTNFYKGLSGNDVVADGGLFVATYKIPPIGTPIWLKVTMPGGYDFEAGGEVRWSRESGAGDAPPGFGASLQSLSQEAKQLIYRYVRNREPLFHDDL